jgi:hypothetical protein
MRRYLKMTPSRPSPLVGEGSRRKAAAGEGKFIFNSFLR